MGRGDRKHIDTLHLIPVIDPNEDVETKPTPEEKDRPEMAQRFEVNAQSLKLLCQDMASFIDKAKNQAQLDYEEKYFERPADAPKSNPELIENINSYFQRMYALLARISNDMFGNEYTGGDVREPLEKKDVSQESITNIEESIQVIKECLKNVDSTDNEQLLFKWLDSIKRAANNVEKNCERFK